MRGLVSALVQAESVNTCAPPLGETPSERAIAASLVLPALMSQPTVEHRAVPAPSSSQGRTLHLPALPAPVVHPSVRHTVVAHTRPVALASAPVPARPKVVVFREMS